MAVRGIPLFALFFIPLSASVIQHYMDGMNFKTKDSVLKFLPYVGIVFLVIFIPLKGTYATSPMVIYKIIISLREGKMIRIKDVCYPVKNQFSVYNMPAEICCCKVNRACKEKTSIDR